MDFSPRGKYCFCSGSGIVIFTLYPTNFICGEFSDYGEILGWGLFKKLFMPPKVKEAFEELLLALNVSLSMSSGKESKSVNLKEKRKTLLNLWSCCPGNLVYDNFLWKILFLEPGVFLWALPVKAAPVEEPGGGKGLSLLSSLCPLAQCGAARLQVKKTGHQGASSCLLWEIVWVGQAEEAVLGHRVCTSHRWCFETLSASFPQPQLCVGIASCLENVFPFRMRLVVHPHP